jgi:glycosyltransferase involved in cell wall biosynthesis
MKIAINALSARVSSGPVFFNNFLPALAAHDTANEYCVIVGAWQATLLAEIPERFERRVISSVTQSFVARVFWEQCVLPFYLRQWQIDVLYSSGNITSLFAGCATVVVMTNSNPFSSLQIEWTAPQKAKLSLVRLFSLLSAKRASRVLFLSENACGLMCRKYSLPLDKTAVVYYGTSFPATPQTSPPKFSEYVLTVSVLLPHKNIDMLMKAFDLLVEAHRFSGLLVVVGAILSPTYYERLLGLRKTLAHGDRIIFTGSVSQDELAVLYKYARLFVFPSLEETFGLPLLEAMGYGVPIAAADCRLAQDGQAYFNPFPEVCGEAAEYFNPLSPESLCASMQRVLGDEQYREQLVACGRERVKQFSWDSTARQTVAVFEALQQ